MGEQHKLCSWWRHPWGKWQRIVVEIWYPHSPESKGGKTERQQRVCEQCGLIQRKDIG